MLLILHHFTLTFSICLICYPSLDYKKPQEHFECDHHTISVYEQAYFCTIFAITKSSNVQTNVFFFLAAIDLFGRASIAESNCGSTRVGTTSGAFVACDMVGVSSSRCCFSTIYTNP